MSQSAQPRASEDADAALAFALRGVLQKLRRKLRDQVDRGDVTPSQVAVLVRLESHGPATVSDLARAEGIRPQSMSAIVAALQSNGFLSARQDPNDGRRTILDLTQACRDWISRDRAIRESWLLHALKTELTADERTRLAEAVVLLDRIADA